jgi:hypothetical protein
MPPFHLYVLAAEASKPLRNLTVPYSNATVSHLNLLGSREAALFLLNIAGLLRKNSSCGQESPRRCSVPDLIGRGQAEGVIIYRRLRNGEICGMM